MEINYAALGKRIKRVRKDKKMSLEELAKKIGISSAHMSNIENGKTKFSLQVLTNIAEALGVTPDVLLLEQVRAKGKTRGVIVQQIDEQLAGCDEAQIFVIEEIVHRMKNLLPQYEQRGKKLGKKTL